MARVCRRICLLRERGQKKEADQLEKTELSSALEAVRVVETDAAVVEKLAALYASETERVANAVVLAELLAPLVASQLQATEMAGRAIATTDAVAPASRAEAPVAAAPARAANPADIAQFIDEMIAQERPPPRAPARRAS